MRRLYLLPAVVGVFLLTAYPALADDVPDPSEVPATLPLSALFTHPTLLGWLFCTALVAYLLSVAVTVMFGSSGYPPNVARIGCWLGASLFILVSAFYIFHILMHWALPIFALIIVFGLVAILGVMLMATRRRVTA